MTIKQALKLIGALLLLPLAGVLAQLDPFADEPIRLETYVLETTLAETGLDPACNGKDAAFLPFADEVAVRCDADFMYINAYSFATHTMMVGITAWNGQVPVPQPIIGENGWRVPMNPTLIGTNTPTVGQGPIAVAINGVMIFNPTRQDGIYAPDADPFLIGELDFCGGHSGRGDDYHYHIAPVCIMELAAESDGTQPIAYALDGFPIYGFTNADGSTPQLDECNGETDPDGNYHYHATGAYPYINGCFKGVFEMSIQPPPQPIREAVPGGPSEILITALYQDETGAVHMEYEVDGTLMAIVYREIDASCFEYNFYTDMAAGTFTTETHCRHEGGGPPPNDGEDRPPRPGDGDNPPPPRPGG